MGLHEISKKFFQACLSACFFFLFFLSTTPAHAQGLVLTRTLSVGSSGPDVAELQDALKVDGFYTYAAITGYFGELTKLAVEAYQSAHGIEAIGSVGPLTRASLASVPGTVTANPSPVLTTSTPTPTAAPDITSTLSVGSSGPQVEALQQFLESQGFYTYPTITGYFGTVTEAAVKAYQSAHGIDPIGIVGPLTQASVAKVSAASTVPLSTTTTSSTSVTTPVTTTSTTVPIYSGGGGGGGGGSSVQQTAPVISSISSSPGTTTTATISWTTDQFSTSQLTYGTTTSYGLTTTLDSNVVTSHQVSLSGLSPGTTYHFEALSTDAAGLESTSPDQTFTTTTTGDLTPPTVLLTAPVASSTLSGSVTLAATATDNVGVTAVQFKIDGVNIGSAATTSPYTYTWNSATVADGVHLLQAIAHDASHNYATSTVSVTVDNTPPVLANGAPSGTLAVNTSSTTLQVITNVAATCKYSTTPGTAYTSMDCFLDDWWHQPHPSNFGSR